MAVAALLRSLASKMARAPPTLVARGLHGGARSGSWMQSPLLHQRGLHSLPTPPISKTDLVAALPKIRAGVAYVLLFGTWVYLHGSVLPRLDSLQAKVEAQKRLEELNDDGLIHEAVELVDERASANVPKTQIMQNSGAYAGHGKQPLGETRKISSRKETRKRRREHFRAEMAKLSLQLQALKEGLHSREDWNQKES